MGEVVLNLKPITSLTHDQFYALCQANPDLQLERTANGELIIVSPVGGEGGSYEADLMIDLGNWNRQSQLGKVFSSSTIFRLPNGAERSPDAAWVAMERWLALSPQEQRGFPPLCPDFVMELRSPTDRLMSLQTKMQEYLDNGLRLGWLINPQDRQVEIYRPGRSTEVVPMPALLSGEATLPGFTLSLDL
jgi:Uma2 family endonuclease